MNNNNKACARALAIVIAAVSVAANAQTWTLRSGDLTNGAGGVGTIDPDVRFSLQGGGSLNSGTWSNVGTWTKASVCDDVRWGMKSRTPSFDANAQWINPSGNNFNPQTALFAHPFNVGNVSSVNITITYVVDDRLGDAANGIDGIYMNNGGLFSTPLGSHTTPTTVSANNVFVISNSTNWLSFYNVDVGTICSGIMYTATIQAVPEPTSLLALAVTVSGLIGRRLRKK